MLLALDDNKLCEVEVGVVFLVVVTVGSVEGRLLEAAVMKFEFRAPQVITPPSRVVQELAGAVIGAEAETETEMEGKTKVVTEAETDDETVAATVVVEKDIPNAELLVGVLRLTPSPPQLTTPPRSVEQVLEGGVTETLTIAPVVTVVVNAIYTVVALPEAGVAVDTDARSVFDAPLGQLS